MDFHFIWYPDISAKVCSSSSVIALYFSCSPTSSSSRRSTSVCNFCTERSENSALASACFNLAEKGLDLLLVACFSLVGLLFRDFQGFEIVSNNSQLFFQLYNFDFTNLCSFFCSLKLTLNLLQPLCNFIVFFVGIFSLGSCSFQFLLKLAHSVFILDCSALQHLPHTVAVISSSGGFVKFVGSEEKFVFTGFKITLKTLNSSVQSINLQLS